VVVLRTPVTNARGGENPSGLWSGNHAGGTHGGFDTRATAELYTMVVPKTQWAAGQDSSRFAPKSYLVQTDYDDDDGGGGGGDGGTA
jgi:hypothetical protein